MVLQQELSQDLEKLVELKNYIDEREAEVKENGTWVSHFFAKLFNYSITGQADQLYNQIKENFLNDDQKRNLFLLESVHKSPGSIIQVRNLKINDRSYTGFIKNGMPEGEGKLTFVNNTNGYEFIGEFVKGNLVKGTKIIDNAIKIEGDFNSDGYLVEGVISKMAGTDSDKKFYSEGKFNEFGNLQGYGRQSHENLDGSYFEGNFKGSYEIGVNSKLLGYGRLVSKDGKVLEEGIYEDGKLALSVKIPGALFNQNKVLSKEDPFAIAFYDKEKHINPGLNVKTLASKDRLSHLEHKEGVLTAPKAKFVYNETEGEIRFRRSDDYGSRGYELVITPNGEVYEGIFEKGPPHDKEYLYQTSPKPFESVKLNMSDPYPSAIYYGEIDKKTGRPHGTGIMDIPEGSDIPQGKYEGMFTEGSFCRGNYTNNEGTSWKWGSVNLGSLLGGELAGFGQKTYGPIFEIGVFDPWTLIDGERHLDNGDYEKGKFKEGKLHGEGVRLINNQLQKGNFINGEFQDK